jgi:hypothetical protein
MIPKTIISKCFVMIDSKRILFQTWNNAAGYLWTPPDLICRALVSVFAQSSQIVRSDVEGRGEVVAGGRESSDNMMSSHTLFHQKPAGTAAGLGIKSTKWTGDPMQIRLRITRNVHLRPRHGVHGPSSSPAQDVSSGRNLIPRQYLNPVHIPVHKS